MQVELVIPQKCRLYSRLRLRIEEFNAISLIETNSRELLLPESVYCHRTEYNLIQWVVRTPARCDYGHSIGALSLVTQLRY